MSREPMNWQQLGAGLRERGWCSDQAWPARQRPGTSWAMQLVAGFGAWLAALLLLSSVGGLLSGLLREGPAQLAAGLVLCAAVAVTVRRRGPQFSAQSSPFAAQLLLAFGIAGASLLAVWLVSILKGGTTVFWAWALLSALLCWANPDPVHRALSAWSCAASLAWAIWMSHGEPLGTGLFALACCLVWLRQTDAFARGHGPMTVAVGYASAAALLGLQLPDASGADLLLDLLRSRETLPTAAARVALLLLAWLVTARCIAARLGVVPTARQMAVVLLAATAVGLACRQMPGVAACLLVWTLGTWAGRNGLRGLALLGLGGYLWLFYFSLQTSLMDKGLMLMATAAVLLGGAWLLSRGSWMRPATPGMPVAPVAPVRDRGGRWQQLLALAGLVLVLAGYNLAIGRNERQLASGQVVRLALAPRDPRAMLTGDYMALNYALAGQVLQQAGRLPAPDAVGAGVWPRAARRALTDDGFAIVTVDDRRLATLARVQPAAQPLAAGEIALRYRNRNGLVALGTNAFYFQEGQAEVYQPARFGEFRVAEDGQMLLVSMLDQDLKPLVP